MPPHITEHTPLIQTVVIAPPRPRYSHSCIRRSCTWILALVLVVIVILFLLPTEWLPGHHSQPEWMPIVPGSSSYPQGSWPLSEGVLYEDVQKILLENPSEDKAREWSKFYASGPHLAGKNLSQAEWTRDKWIEFGIQAHIVQYEIYINYPVSHRLALVEAETSDASKEESEKESFKVKYECRMEEDVLEEDPTSGLEDRIPTFHGYSASGNVTGQYVFVNFGTHWDFQDLIDAGVELKGKIALAKYGRIFRGLKVKQAQDLGMIGVVVYSDPQEDGEITELNGVKPYPEGPARQPSSVQRGSVQFINILPGDPTTPGRPSLPGVERSDPHYSTPTIPSVPISYLDALPLLKALNGHGPSASDFNEYWQGGGLAHKGVQYNIGPSPPNLALHLQNEQEYVITPLWDVIGTINGSIPDEVVVLGNHRDAWIAGGAVDPNSGSTAMNELIRSFGIALEKGWRPLRTLVFASWDGEEYGLIGSTEWVEEHIPWLSKTAVAYLNVDIATSGPNFIASASPLLNKALRYATSLVTSPNQTTLGQTVFDLWGGKIRTLGSGSDYTAFQDHAGIPSLDMTFTAGPTDPIYHYHSNYDSFAWVNRFGDPTYSYHTAMTKVLGLMALEVAENAILGLHATDYAVALSSYIDALDPSSSFSLSHTNVTMSPSSLSSAQSSPSLTHLSLPQEFLGILRHSTKHFLHRATHFDARAAHLNDKLKRGIPWWHWWRKAHLYKAVRHLNQKYIQLERHFLHEGGLDSREWFKHVVFAPGIWTGYAGATFPGLVEALEAGDSKAVEEYLEETGANNFILNPAQRWTYIIKERIDAAAVSLH